MPRQLQIERLFERRGEASVDDGILVRTLVHLMFAWEEEDQPGQIGYRTQSATAAYFPSEYTEDLGEISQPDEREVVEEYEDFAVHQHPKSAYILDEYLLAIVQGTIESIQRLNQYDQQGQPVLNVETGLEMAIAPIPLNQEVPE